jgi:hypothetical protein
VVFAATAPSMIVLTGSQTEDGVLLSWTGSNGQQVQVYRSNSPGVTTSNTLIYDGIDSTFIDTNSSEENYYKVYLGAQSSNEASVIYLQTITNSIFFGTNY